MSNFQLQIYASTAKLGMKNHQMQTKTNTFHKDSTILKNLKLKMLRILKLHTFLKETLQ